MPSFLMFSTWLSRSLIEFVGLATVAAAALQVDFTSPASIRAAAALVAQDLLTFYHGNEPGQTPGILPGPPPAGPYYWWQGGAMFGTLVDYWHYTGDTSFVNETRYALIFQSGNNHDYQPTNWTASLGNDDQAFWGMSSMTAAETNFPNPPPSDPRQYLALVQAVFNTQADPTRHDSYCNGGMRWQIPATNTGYDYKNTIANGCFFAISARLARYTGNDTYADYARNTYNWILGVNFVDAEYNVFDGGHIEHNCTDINRAQFSYNSAILLKGAAFMYNYTAVANMTQEAAYWKGEVNKLLNGTLRNFFPRGVAFEPPCEGNRNCNSDMVTYRGYLHRWMALTAQLCPWTHDIIMPVLLSSTKAAVKTCAGGDNGRMCGFYWEATLDGAGFQGDVGAGEQMNVVAALSSLLIADTGLGSPPVTSVTGGTSGSNPGLGSGSNPYAQNLQPTTMGDKVGAGILTALIIGGILSVSYWMCVD